MNSIQGRKIVRRGLIISLFTIQFLFLLLIVIEQKAPFVVIAGTVIILFFVLYSYFRRPLHLPTIQTDSLKIVVWLPIGALVSFFINQKLGLGPVIGGALTGFIASLIPEINKKSFYLSMLPEVIYCGAFIGMTGTNVTGSFGFVIVASVFTSIFFMFSRTLLQGVGGKAGTLAFIGVCLASLIFQLVLWMN